jgi:hypothetical protein
MFLFAVEPNPSLAGGSFSFSTVSSGSVFRIGSTISPDSIASFSYFFLSLCSSNRFEVAFIFDASAFFCFSISAC